MGRESLQAELVGEHELKPLGGIGGVKLPAGPNPVPGVGVEVLGARALFNDDFARCASDTAHLNNHDDVTGFPPGPGFLRIIAGGGPRQLTVIAAFGVLEDAQLRRLGNDQQLGGGGDLPEV